MLRWTDYKTGKPISEAKTEAETAAATSWTGCGRARISRPWPICCARGGEAVGRYLFLKPDLDDPRFEVAVPTRTGAGRRVPRRGQGACSAAWDAGSFFPRVVDPAGRNEPGRCEVCAVAEACVRGDRARGCACSSGRTGGGTAARRLLRKLPFFRSGGCAAKRGGAVTAGRLLVGAFGMRRDDGLCARPTAKPGGRRRRRFDRPLVLQAGAGTGKTTTLIGRLLAWCLGAGWDRKESGSPSGPRRAITSTAARSAMAAEVLRRRRGHHLHRGGGGRDGRPGRPRAGAPWPAAARRRPGSTLRSAAARGAGAAGPRPRSAPSTTWPCRTIHAFCRGLLADHPLEAGVHPDLTVDAEGRLLEQVVQETVEDSLREGYGDPGDPDLLALAARGFGPREVAAALIALVQAGMPVGPWRKTPSRRRRIEELRGTG